ncbi:MAG TPA: 50S ribosomal protein L35 [Candidatus Binataceae bacterium]|jgi:large subunit ribosomal protein L35|nr:50S ribosomal protein L35 [Candidatus Binataceae bacterium]
MPKIKTNRAAAKRFKVTKGGKVKYKKGYSRHHAWAKNRGRKRRLRMPGILKKTEGEVVKTLLPYA